MSDREIPVEKLAQEPGESEKAEEPIREPTIVLARAVMPAAIPIIPLKQRPLFPGMIVPLLIQEDRFKKIIGDVNQPISRYIGLVLVRARDENDQTPTELLKSSELYRIGVVGEITRTMQPEPDAPIQCIVAIRERFSIESIVQEEPYIVASVRYLLETDMSLNDELKAYSLAVIASIKEMMQLNPLFKEELSMMMSRSEH